MPRVKVQDIPYSLSFDGGTSKVAYTTPTSIVNMTAYTVSAWINIAGLGGGSLGRVIDNNGIAIFTQGMGATYKITGQRTYSVTASAAFSNQLLYNKWYHMCVTWAGTGSRPVVYINGVISNSGGSDQSGTTTTVAATTTLGNRSDNIRGLKGSLSDVKVYDRSLTASEVAGEFANSSITSTASRYLFTEGSGTTATDSSGNNNNGTITNGTWSTDTPTKLRTASSNRVAIQDVKSSLSGSSKAASVDTGITPSSTSFSIGFWHKSTNQATAENVWTCLNATDGINIQHDSGSAMYYAASKISSVTTFNKNFGRVYQGWNHFVLTATNNSFIGYLNGTQVFSHASAMPVAAVTAKLLNANCVGGMSNYMLANGTIWTAQEALDLYKSNKMPSGVTQYLPLQEGAGTTAYDSSGNGNHGTITSGTFTSDVPTKKRGVVGGNLVYNGDFSYVPPSGANVATTTNVRFADGTATGSITNNLFGWGILISAGAGGLLLDTSVTKNGKNSLKISSLDTSGNITVSPFLSVVAPTAAQAIKLEPSTSYTWSGWVKTSNVGANGAYIDLREYTGAMATVATTSTSKLSGTTDWTYVTGTATTGATTRYGAIILRNVIPGTISDAWFSNIELRPTTPTTRTAA